MGAGEGRPGAKTASSPILTFLFAELAGGVVLVLATIAALVWANGPAAEGYVSFWHRSLTVGFGDAALTKDLQHWVNDGLMAVFFFVVALEIKYELAVGQLRRFQAALLPALAALGGVVLPAALYLLLAGGGAAARGWGIPMATDIAFAVGVLALLGSRVSSGAKLFLLSLAIVDDLIAILVIAVFYSGKIRWDWLGVALLGLGVVVLLKRLQVRTPLAYIFPALLVWVATLESGVHATLAGVALGLLTPASPVRGRDVLRELEHALQPLSALIIVPIFALANAGVDFRGGVLGEAFGQQVTWAIIAGLLAGKLFGISAITYAARRIGWGVLPAGMHPREVWGVAALGGIGFTVSLFITDLAFDDPGLITGAKVGIFTASVAAALIGVVLLLLTPRGTVIPEVEEAPDFPTFAQDEAQR